ncbi:hypothetical protein EDC04DRAFT_2606695 [Pisolithus marmoratus]|nr:hypothetical protein EDC04DRAFT_2606695 [Pisolithus marmoratus]
MSPTRPRNSSPGHVVGGLQASAGDRMTYDTTRRALLDGVPVDILYHFVLLDFVRHCADMAEAVYDEQQRVARVLMRDNGSMLALDAGESILDNELKLFHPVQMQHINELMECADGVMNDLECRRIPTAFWDLTFSTKEVLTILETSAAKVAWASGNTHGNEPNYCGDRRGLPHSRGKMNENAVLSYKEDRTEEHSNADGVAC